MRIPGRPKLSEKHAACPEFNRISSFKCVDSQIRVKFLRKSGGGFSQNVGKADAKEVILP